MSANAGSRRAKPISVRIRDIKSANGFLSFSLILSPIRKQSFPCRRTLEGLKRCSPSLSLFVLISLFYSFVILVSIQKLVPAGHREWIEDLNIKERSDDFSNRPVALMSSLAPWSAVIALLWKVSTSSGC